MFYTRAYLKGEGGKRQVYSESVSHFLFREKNQG
jgi:hypothetical protein